jgi:predicted dehydrogenase
MTKSLEIAVFGAGGFGRHHVRILAGMEGVDLVAVCDPDPGRRAEVHDAYGVPAIPDPAGLPDGVRAAIVAVPTVDHRAVAVPLLERGIACLVEKPLAKDRADAEAIVAAARRGGAVLGVGHVERFNPALMAALAHRVAPRFVECRRVAPFSFRSSDIGVVLDLMIHDIDICLALDGTEVVRVDACGTPVLGIHEDIANARIEFASGCVADVTASRVATKVERKVRLFCPDAYLSLDYQTKSGVLYRKSPKLTPEYVTQLSKEARTIADLKGLVFGDLLRVESLSMKDHDPLTKELEDFVDAVREGRDPTVSGRDGARAVEVAVRILSSIGSSPVLR